jgi:tRNA(Ile)-lysidine synthase
VGPHPAVAQARACVRRSLGDLEPGDLVLAACSGGADSLALAAALAHEAPRLGLRGGGVTVDHGLQEESAAQAARVEVTLLALGLDPVRQVRVTVPPRAGGPEAAARSARYTALEQEARQTGATAVLLAHTLDDQAETVLLGLARGSGARALAGMAARRGRFRRPMLGLARATLRAACLAQRLEPWDDPHNSDPSYARVRVRHQALPALEKALGPGIAEALARSAAQLAADCEALDDIARGQEGRIRGPDATGDIAGGTLATLDIEGLAELAPAIRTRVLRQAALMAGCPGGSLTATHVAALDALVTGWHGQQGADLPGAVQVQRRYGRLLFSVSPASLRDRGGGVARGGPVMVGSPERTEAEAAGGRE